MTHPTPLFALLLGCLLSTPVGARAQRPVPLMPDDSARRAALLADGVIVDRPHVRLLVPAGLYEAAHLDALADSLDGAIAVLDRLIGERPWRRHRGPVDIHLPDERFVSHASGGGSVFIPAGLARQGLAPWLHESAHELLVPAAPYHPIEFEDMTERMAALERFPLWLFEGLAEYVARTAARRAGFVEGDVLEVGGLEHAPANCATGLEARPELASYIGAAGIPRQLFGSGRDQIVTTYYACALSYTTLLVDELGLDAVLEAFRTDDPVGALEALSGESAEVRRERWLASLPAS